MATDKGRGIVRRTILKEGNIVVVEKLDDDLSGRFYISKVTEDYVYNSMNVSLRGMYWPDYKYNTDRLMKSIMCKDRNFRLATDVEKAQYNHYMKHGTDLQLGEPPAREGEVLNTTYLAGVIRNSGAYTNGDVDNVRLPNIVVGSLTLKGKCSFIGDRYINWETFDEYFLCSLEGPKGKSAHLYVLREHIEAAVLPSVPNAVEATPVTHIKAPLPPQKGEYWSYTHIGIKYLCKVDYYDAEANELNEIASFYYDDKYHVASSTTLNRFSTHKPIKITDSYTQRVVEFLRVSKGDEDFSAGTSGVLGYYVKTTDKGMWGYSREYVPEGSILEVYKNLNVSPNAGKDVCSQVEVLVGKVKFFRTYKEAKKYRLLLAYGGGEQEPTVASSNVDALTPVVGSYYHLTGQGTGDIFISKVESVDGDRVKCSTTAVLDDDKWVLQETTTWCKFDGMKPKAASPFAKRVLEYLERFDGKSRIEVSIPKVGQRKGIWGYYVKLVDEPMWGFSNCPKFEIVRVHHDLTVSRFIGIGFSERTEVLKDKVKFFFEKSKAEEYIQGLEMKLSKPDKNGKPILMHQGNVFPHKEMLRRRAELIGITEVIEDSTPAHMLFFDPYKGQLPDYLKVEIPKLKQ